MLFSTFSFAEYDIPCENDTSELNTSDMNTSNADESVPGLAMGTSAASSLPVPTAEGTSIDALKDHNKNYMTHLFEIN